MDKELLKAIIEELGAAALEAVAGKKFATLAIRFAISIMTRDIVLDKLIGLFGSNPATFAGTIKAHVAAKGLNVVASNGPELSIEEMESRLAAQLAG